MALGDVLFCVQVMFLELGCERKVINHGYGMETADFDKIIIGKDTIEDVFKKLGSPTIRSSVVHSNGDYCWYYAAKRMKKFGFMKPTVIDQKIYIITFNNKNIVKSLEKSSYERTIHMVSDTTKSGGRTQGVFKETFGGVGKHMQKFNK